MAGGGFASPNVQQPQQSSRAAAPYSVAAGSNAYTQQFRPSNTMDQFYGSIYQPQYTGGPSAGYSMNAGLGGWNNSYSPGFFGQNYGGFGPAAPVYGQGMASTSGDLAGGALSGLGGQNVGLAANPYATGTQGISAQVLPTFAKGGIASLIDNT